MKTKSKDEKADELRPEYVALEENACFKKKINDVFLSIIVIWMTKQKACLNSSRSRGTD